MSIAAAVCAICSKVYSSLTFSMTMIKNNTASPFLLPCDAFSSNHEQQVNAEDWKSDACK